MTLLPLVSGDLECLLQESAHLVGGVLLHLCRDVGVGVEGEPGAVVAEDAGQGFYVYAVLQRQRRKSVSQIVESHLVQPCPLQHPLEHFPRAVGLG